jgi:transposase
LLSRDNEIEHLKLLIAKLRRMQFGRKSEKLDRQIEQLELRLDELQATQAENVAASHTPARVAPVASIARNVHAVQGKPARKPLPEHLPREVRKYPPKQKACPDCGGELKSLGEDVSEILEYVPARFKVIRQVRPKLACACCERIVQAEAPSRPIERGVAGPGLLAHVLVSKYCDHLPLYRQSEIYAREGVELERSTLADWVGGTSQLLAPLVEALRRHVLSATKLHADDTPVPVLAPGNGKTKTGRLWTYVRDDRPAGDATPAAVWFAYSPDRKGEHPQAHLEPISRARCRPMVTRDSMRCTKPGAFRKRPAGRMCAESFTICIWRIKSPVAAEAMERIAALYAIEKEIRGHALASGAKSATRKRDRCWTR